ncbi:hypothetical protein I8748_19335 [Nostoc sp. CENA67]|uniref:Uncharacterized protein n=1 Tax=Amazonocrinis nigriterrae CENA67 TaxID=2794033 RepID=A0A8J7HXN6_9NOST|nr:hypothetical protein [Amazonocrinis nigriterrae]MBH8564314.1 hypothetical protein [Amazonocrinis nigriterrae CENA67]
MKTKYKKSEFSTLQWLTVNKVKIYPANYLLYGATNQNEEIRAYALSIGSLCTLQQG